MGDLVLGRLVRAVKRSASASGEVDAADAPIAARRWVPFGDIAHTLDGCPVGLAERAGRGLIDDDVRVGPYRFLRPELSVSTLDHLGVAVFRSYFSDPRLEIGVRDESLYFRWIDPERRSPAFWAFVDGMAKRLTELARVEVTTWRVVVTENARTLRAERA